VLHKNAMTPVRIDDARKTPLTGEAAWQVLADAREIVVAKGTQEQIFDPRTDDKAAILAATLGRTGNLRAPTLRIGDRLLVGFNERLYARIAGEHP